MARTNISVDQTVFDQFSAIAQQENKTLFAFTNEWLSAVTHLTKEGWSPSQVNGLCRSISLLKEIDVLTLPSDFVDELLAKMYKNNKEELLQMFRDLGSSLVGLLKIASSNIDDLSELAKEFIVLLPVKHFKILKDEDGNIEVDIVGVGGRKESAECTFEFLQAVLNGYGYSVSNHESGVGTLRIWALKTQFA